MGTLFRLTDEGAAPSPGTTVIKAAEYATYTEANALIEQARAHAADIERKAAEAYEERKQEGYRDGLEEGKF